MSKTKPETDRPALNNLPVVVIKDTEEEREARIFYILEYIKAGNTTKSACSRCGVSYRAFLNWVQKDPDLMAEYESIKADLHEQVGEICKLAAMRALEDPRYQTSLIFYLKAQAGWSDGSNYNNNHPMPSITFKKKE